MRSASFELRAIEALKLQSSKAPELRNHKRDTDTILMLAVVVIIINFYCLNLLYYITLNVLHKSGKFPHSGKIDSNFIEREFERQIAPLESEFSPLWPSCPIPNPESRNRQPALDRLGEVGEVGKLELREQWPSLFARLGVSVSISARVRVRVSARASVSIQYRR